MGRPPATVCPLPATAAGPRRRAALDGAICSEIPRLGNSPDAIATGFPSLAAAGGYRLDRLAGSPGADLAKFVMGSEGTLVAIIERPCAGTRAPPPCDRGRPPHSMEAAIAATDDALAAGPPRSS